MATPNDISFVGFSGTSNTNISAFHFSGGANAVRQYVISGYKYLILNRNDGIVMGISGSTVRRYNLGTGAQIGSDITGVNASMNMCFTDVKGSSYGVHESATNGYNNVYEIDKDGNYTVHGVTGIASGYYIRRLAPMADNRVKDVHNWMLAICAQTGTSVSSAYYVYKIEKQTWNATLLFSYTPSRAYRCTGLHLFQTHQGKIVIGSGLNGATYNGDYHCFDSSGTLQWSITGYNSWYGNVTMTVDEKVFYLGTGSYEQWQHRNIANGLTYAVTWSANKEATPNRFKTIMMIDILDTLKDNYRPYSHKYWVGSGANGHHYPTFNIAERLTNANLQKDDQGSAETYKHWREDGTGHQELIQMINGGRHGSRLSRYFRGGKFQFQRIWRFPRVGVN